MLVYHSPTKQCSMQGSSFHPKFSQYFGGAYVIVLSFKSVVAAFLCGDVRRDCHGRLYAHAVKLNKFITKKCHIVNMALYAPQSFFEGLLKKIM